MAHRRLKSMLPLPADFFLCAPLSEDQESDMIASALDSLTAALRMARLQRGQIDWTLHSETDGVNLFIGSGSPHKGALFQGVTDIHATLEEAATIMDVSTQAKYKHYAQTVGKDILDCATLYDLAMPTPAHPRNYIGVKWCILEHPSALLKCRDFCLLDSCDDFVLNGRRGWMRLKHSVHVAACPDLQSVLDVVRAHVYLSGYIFLETDTPGMLRVQHLTHVDLRGNIPQWLLHLTAKARAKELGAIESHFRRKRLSRLMFLELAELVPPAIRKRCFLCQSSFSPFLVKKNCRKCGEVVCRKCSQYWDVTADDGHHRAVRICSRCSVAHSCTSDTTTAAWARLPDQSLLDRSRSHPSSEKEYPIATNSSRGGMMDDMYLSTGAEYTYDESAVNVPPHDLLARQSTAENVGHMYDDDAIRASLARSMYATTGYHHPDTASFHSHRSGVAPPPVILFDSSDLAVPLHCHDGDDGDDDGDVANLSDLTAFSDADSRVYDDFVDANYNPDEGLAVDMTRLTDDATPDQLLAMYEQLKAMTLETAALLPPNPTTSSSFESPLLS
ncbi:Aste57867_8470 [Aphanomyces stellatus]|uniref:Aste57867_8470 protein n=1 Tax=Aphanomyces stellatus TaxID=120398 RepID=A0A485KKD7_9STRA|nr:hypothetical protein As57867_008438 [Aphanomyces stellatus]VFT85356.1 Aste57867_8470 [Aphanomyces stellatus]